MTFHGKPVVGWIEVDDKRYAIIWVEESLLDREPQPGEQGYYP